MSHYCNIELEMTGDAEAIVRALMEMKFFSRKGKVEREDIEVHEEAKNLVGYQGDTRSQKANIIIRRKNCGSASNDIGFEKMPNGKWKAHISEYDVGLGYNQNWQKQLLSKWAIQKVGVEAEQRGHSWEVKYATEEGKQFAYVHVHSNAW